MTRASRARTQFLAVMAGFTLTVWPIRPSGAADVEFNRDIRPILSENCLVCHGPDTRNRKAGLRLDEEKSVRAGLPNGNTAVVPGQPDESELIARVEAEDPNLKMPPPKSGKTLTQQQVELLRSWVSGGALWEPHWSLAPIKRPLVPFEREPGFIKTPVDAFMLVKWEKQGLSHAAEADRVTLIRRLSFDLTGLPPKLEEVDQFLADPNPDAYEHLVDRLLATPHFGERMAMFWLDLVRYADSVGYHGDQPISVSPFRDYVIKSFNENKRFDRFTVEQLAGDLLDRPTLEQRVAAGYNRLGMMSAEGGVQPKEYLAKYAAERVRNIGGAWLGATLGCCECHDHKFDPFMTRDFYRLEAFFADIKEKGLYENSDFGPMMPVPSPEQAAMIEAFDRQIGLVKQSLDRSTPELEVAQDEWERTVTLPFEDADSGVPKPVREALAVAPSGRSQAQRDLIKGHFRSVTPNLRSEREALVDLETRRKAVADQVVTMVETQHVEPRPIRVLKRGNWMDDTGEIVTPGVPAVLPQPLPHDRRLTRLDLAQWLVSSENPLTARTLVNRLWKLYFGAGLSKKLDDLGSQGDWPSHPELLDYLAGQLIDSGWNVKSTIKLIVMSSTYRMSSLPSPEQVEKDPLNRWLTRQGRFRLDAECVRDSALTISGLLMEDIGGPSAKPFQPPGYWSFLNFPTREWQADPGSKRYRRGLYVHWQRQYLYPSFLAFDAPSREECAAERGRSNTPLQALVVLNDPVYVEAARAFARRMIHQGGPTLDSRLDWAFRTALSRPIRSEERTVLASMFGKHLEEYRADPDAARALIAVGEHRDSVDIDPAELAAAMSVTRTILNLHATITRN